MTYNMASYTVMFTIMDLVFQCIMVDGLQDVAICCCLNKPHAASVVTMSHHHVVFCTPHDEATSAG